MAKFAVEFPVENASDDFPSKRSSKISFQTSPEVRHQFRRKLCQLHSGNRWCLKIGRTPEESYSPRGHLLETHFSELLRTTYEKPCENHFLTAKPTANPFLGSCAMTTKFLDDKIFKFKFLLSWRFPRKQAFWGNLSLSAPNTTPLKNHEFYLYCRLAISDFLRTRIPNKKQGGYRSASLRCMSFRHTRDTSRVGGLTN